MDWLVWLLFESPGALAAVLGTALFVLLVYWRRRGRARPLLVGLAVAVVLLVVQALVTTRREHAGRILAAVEADIVQARTDALAEALAADFAASGMDRAAFLAYVRGKMEVVDVRWLDRQSLRVEQSGGARFAVSVGYLADAAGEYGGSIPSRWWIEFARTPAGWRIVHIRCLRLAWLEAPTWADLDRH